MILRVYCTIHIRHVNSVHCLHHEIVKLTMVKFGWRLRLAFSKAHVTHLSTSVEVPEQF